MKSYSSGIRLAKARALASTSLAAMLAFATTQQAQAADATAAQAAQAPAVEEIVVTGRRVIRDGYEAPTPVSVVATEAIEAAARPDLADFLNTLPAVAGSFTPQSGTGNLSNARGGINAISLHGLGAARTLVLLDGHRAVDSSAFGDIDVSSFPQGLVSRVDVVTGGASAAYGSDAVGGVVNFILDKNFTGIKGDINGAVSHYGDDQQYKASLAGGVSFGDGRGHALFSAEYARNKGIPKYSDARDWAAYGWAAVLNPTYSATNGQPQYLFGPNTGDAQIVAGGIIVSGPLKGVAFSEGGKVRQFQYGSITSGILTRGGDWAVDKQWNDAVIDPPTNRKNAFVRVSYDVTDTVEAHVEASWADNWEANGISGLQFPGNLTLLASNPYLPASVAAQAAAAKVTSFAYGYLIQFDDPDDETVKNSSGATGILALLRRISNRELVGLNGKFDAAGTEWSWDAYYQRGTTRTSERTADNLDNAKFRLALDSTINPANGQIVCRSTLTAPGNGCVPFNPFGLHVNGPGEYHYFIGTSLRNQRLTEDVAAVSVHGDVFQDWAGPVSVATGVEWRSEKINGTSDAVSAGFGWINSSYQPTNGKYNVKEGFLEALVPLAKDVAWAQNWDVDLAGRVTDYSTSGTVETWKVGSTLQFIPAVRVRGSISKDVRAPNLGELYAGGSNSASSSSGLLDPFNGNLPSNGALTINGSGNPALKPESAISKGFGTVIQPDFWPGFSFSVDYWDINMTGAVSTLGAQDTINQCYLGKSQLCAAVIRKNNIITIITAPYNVASSIYRGIDFEAGYTVHLSDVSPNWDGTLGVRFLATDLLKNYSNDNVTPAVDLVGQTSNRKWRYNASITYTNDPITLVAQMRGFSAGQANNLYIQCESGCPASTTVNPTVNDMSQRGEFDVDTTFTYKVTDYASAYLSVQNWLNRSPPPIITGVGSNPTTYFDAPSFSRGMYDATGRMYRIGIRFKM